MHELSSGTQRCVRNSLNTFSEMPPFSDPRFCLSHNKRSHFSFQKKCFSEISIFGKCTHNPEQRVAFVVSIIYVYASYLPHYSVFTHNHLSEMHTFSFIQSTVAARTPPLWAVRRRGDLQHLEGTPGEALDQQVTHRWAQGSHKARNPSILRNLFADLAQ